MVRSTGKTALLTELNVADLVEFPGYINKNEKNKYASEP